MNYRIVNNADGEPRALVSEGGRVFYDLETLAATFEEVAAEAFPLNPESDIATESFAQGIQKVVNDIRDSLSFLRTIAE